MGFTLIHTVSLFGTESFQGSKFWRKLLGGGSIDNRLPEPVDPRCVCLRNLAALDCGVEPSST